MKAVVSSLLLSLSFTFSTGLQCLQCGSDSDVIDTDCITGWSLPCIAKLSYSLSLAKPTTRTELALSIHQQTRQPTCSWLGCGII